MIKNYYLTITVIDNRIFLTTTPLSILVVKDDDDDEERKSCFKTPKNGVCYSL